MINQALNTKRVNFEISMAAGTSNVIKMMIKYQEILWTIPSFLLAQIRRQYESDQMRKYKDKSVSRMLLHKHFQLPRTFFFSAKDQIGCHLL
jgi:hypothetical protein